MTKKYQSAEKYEKKLEKVMSRIGATKYDYDWGRKSCYVQFLYKGKAYRFENSVEALQSRKIDIAYGSDAFAILVLDLECIARMMEHGTFDLEHQQISGLQQLPEHTEVPECIRMLNFDYIPTEEELKKRYRDLCKVYHPDAGGNENSFRNLAKNYDEAQKWLIDNNNESGVKKE